MADVEGDPKGRGISHGKHRKIYGKMEKSWENQRNMVYTGVFIGGISLGNKVDFNGKMGKP